MKKRFYLLAILLLPCMAFAQSKLPFTSSKPFNKGNIVLNMGYEKQPEFGLRGRAPKICLSAGYGFTNWCVAGFYADYGRDFFSYAAYGTDDYWCQFHSNYLAYGIHTELHPIAPLLPGFYFLDVYALVRAGMHHYICSVVSEEGGEDPLQARVSGTLKNSVTPYISGGWGMAINPSKYFGVFYERTYNTLPVNHIISSESPKHHLYHRFGLNIRFGGPKKWRPSEQ